MMVNVIWVVVAGMFCGGVFLVIGSLIGAADSRREYERGVEAGWSQRPSAQVVRLRVVRDRSSRGGRGR